jgi:hypothetical protein
MGPIPAHDPQLNRTCCTARRQGRRLHAFATASRDRIRVYTPHGGSLHFPLSTLKGNIYARVERALMNDTDLFLFESAFARDTYQRTIGTPKGWCDACSTASPP